MTTDNPTSATIYTFPARGRFAVVAEHIDSTLPANVPIPRGAIVAAASGWYHEEAVKAEQRRKN